MRSTIFTLLCSFISLTLFAQQPEYDWQLQVGLNIIDLYPVGKSSTYFPNQGSFLEGFANTNHWNYGVPALGLFRSIEENLSAGLVFGFAGVTEIEGQTPRNINYFTGNLQLKYALIRQKTLSPYTRLGLGFSTFNNEASQANSIVAENRTSSHFMGSIGMDILLGEQFGLYLETNYMSGFGRMGISHFAHGLGLSYGLGLNDQDKDGIPDKKDACVEIPGLAAFNGCPDTDKDGLPDQEDACPLTKGPLGLNGCPDTDQDGIIDSEDICPEEAGPQENLGCPYLDSDEDGLLDFEDDCPNKKGSTATNGCPDSDGDGISDLEDSCPNTFGQFDLDGCPTLSEEEQTTLNTIAGKLYFMGGSTKIIGARNIESIRTIFDMLQKDKHIQLLIEGHTSSEGGAEYNLELSKRRAESVRLRLMEEGITPDRLEIIGYGDTRPLQSNETAQGRAKNKRVEFKRLESQ